MTDSAKVGTNSKNFRRVWASILLILLLISTVFLVSLSVAANHPPVIEIMEPGDGATVSGVVTIWMVAWDLDGNDNITDVWVKIDGGTAQNATYNHTDIEGQWWYFEWDTTLETEGWHSITAIVFDGMDDGSDLIEVYVDNIPDNNPPVIEIVHPSAGATVNGVVTIWMVASDPDGNDNITDVWVKIDGGSPQNATYNHTNPEGQWWYFEWDTTLETEGWHSITAIVFDGMDDGSDLIEVYVDNIPDNNPPVIEIVHPSAGATVSGVVTIWMVASDPDGNDEIQDVWVKIDNGPLMNATYNHTNGEGQWWYYIWDTTSETDGWHHIYAYTWDGIDDAMDVIEVIVDNVPENSPPGIVIVEPAAGSTVNGIVVIWMNAWDVDGNDEILDVWVRIDWGIWLNATYNHTNGEGQWWYYEWDTTSETEGEHHISAIVYDGLDYGDDLIGVLVDNVPDNNPPVIDIVHPPAGAIVSGVVTIWMIASDPDGNDEIQDVWVRIDDGSLMNATYNHTNGEGQWWYYEWDTTVEDEGWHHIYAYIWDGVEEAMDVIEVIVDNVPENNPPGIAIIHPDDGATVSGTVVIWMNAWDEDGNGDIEEVWVRIDWGTWLNATYNHTNGEGQWWYYEWDTTLETEGEHHISAIVYDGLDYGDDLIGVLVDNVPENHAPGIEIVEPAHGETVSGTIVIWMVAWDMDGNDEIQEVWVTIDDGALRNATYNHTNGEGQWWFYEWDTIEVDDGWHHIRAIVFDGIDDGHDIIEVYVQNEEPNHAPGIEIVEPVHGETVSGTVTIWMVASDPDGNDEIQGVWVRIDGGAMRNATYHHEDAEGQWWFYEWDTTEVDDGWHWITAIVFDGMEDASDIIEIIVDNGPENHEPGIEIMEPGHGDTVSGTITIWMVAWDHDGNDDIDNVWVRIDGGALREATYHHEDADGQWWYYEWDTTEVDNGWHAVTAIVYDGIHDGHDTIEVYVHNEEENHAPGIEIVEPDDGDTVSGTIVIWMVAWDPDGNEQIENVWVRIDDGDLLEATYDMEDGEGQWWYFEWDTTEVENGWHLITAIVFDGMDDGHHAIEIHVHNEVENHAPGIEIVEPGHGDTVSGTVVIWMVAWDPDGNDDITNVWVRIDGGDLLEATYDMEDGEGQWWYFEWDTTEVENGWHDITAVVFDGIDDGHDVIEVHVNNGEENHAPGIEIVEPEGGATVSGTVIIWMVAWDLDGNDDIENVWVRIDDGDLLEATYDHTDGEGQWWFFEWDSTEVDNGWHLITAIVFDGIDDGHDAIEVHVHNEEENHAPGIEIVEPEHGATVNSTVIIWMLAWDLDGNDDIENVWVRIDDGALREATYDHTDGEGQWWFYEWDTTEVEDGWHDIRAIVFDGMDDGHDVIEVLVDNVEPNHAPGIVITEPEHGATVSGTVVIWMNAWDEDGNDDIENVWVRIDDGDLLEATYDHTDGEGQWWYFEWDTTEVDDGWHAVTAVVFDGEDDGHDVIEVFVVNEEEGFLSALILLLMALLTAMGLIGAVTATEVGKFGLLNLIVLPLYTKISKKDILDHFVRGEIYGYLKVNPGDNYTTIKKNLDLNNGTLTYHLSVLEREGLIKSWNHNGHKYFYPKGVKIPGNGVKNPSILDAILKSITDSPGITVKDIAAITGISRQLANYHIRRLAAEGKIDLERKSLSKNCYLSSQNKNA